MTKNPARPRSSRHTRTVAIAIGLLLAVSAALAPAQGQAKHTTPDNQSDEDSQAPPPPDQTNTGHATVIKAEVEETHDRLTPDQEFGIQWVRVYVISLSGKNNVSETIRSRFMGSSSSTSRMSIKRHVSRGGEIQRSGLFGENDGQVVWHVVGEHKLQRIAIGKQYLMMMEITIDGGTCQIDAKFLLQTGYTDVIMRRGGGEEEHFTLPHVERASCTIESS
jgi:hypothetical protein